MAINFESRWFNAKTLSVFIVLLLFTSLFYISHSKNVSNEEKTKVEMQMSAKRIDLKRKRNADLIQAKKSKIDLEKFPKFELISDQYIYVNEKKFLNFGVSYNGIKFPCENNIIAESDNEKLLPNDSIIISGKIPACQVELIPLKDQVGLANIVFTIKGNGRELFSYNPTASFDFEVRSLEESVSKKVEADSKKNHDKLSSPPVKLK